MDRTAAIQVFLFVLLITYYNRIKNPPPKQPSLNAVTSDQVDNHEIDRHRHDGTQPDLESAYPGQKPTIAWM